MEHVQMHNVQFQYIIIKWFEKGLCFFYYTNLVGHEIQAEMRISAKDNCIQMNNLLHSTGQCSLVQREERMCFASRTKVSGRLGYIVSWE